MLVVKKVTYLVPKGVLNVDVKISDLTISADYRLNIPDKIDTLLNAEIFYEKTGLRADSFY